MAMLGTEPWANQPPASQPAAFFLLATPACIKNPTTATATITTYSSTLLRSELHRQVPFPAAAAARAKQGKRRQQTLPRDNKRTGNNKRTPETPRSPPHARLAGLPGIWIACKGDVVPTLSGRLWTGYSTSTPKWDFYTNQLVGFIDIYYLFIYLFNFFLHFRSGP